MNNTAISLTGESLLFPLSLSRPLSVSSLDNYRGAILGFDPLSNHTVEQFVQVHQASSGPCVRLGLGCGVEVGLGPSEKLFVHSKGWVAAHDLKVGDRLLSPSNLGFYTEKNVSGSTDLFPIPSDTFLLGRPDLIEFLKRAWTGCGRMFPSLNSLGFIVHDLQLAIDLQYLLLKIGVVSRISSDLNLFVDDVIDQGMFLNLIGIDYPLFDIRSPRKWEIVITVRKLDDYPLFKVYSNSTIMSSYVVINSENA